MTDRKKVIAVLDDEAKMRLALARLLKTHGYDVAPFESGVDFLKAVESDRPDCMLLDLHMPRTTGFDVLESMFSMRVGVPIIVITGHDEPGNAERVRDLRVSGQADAGGGGSFTRAARRSRDHPRLPWRGDDECAERGARSQ